MRLSIAHPSKCHLFCLKVVKLIDVFPYGTGFVLVFEYMLSDLSEVLRNSDKPLTEASAQLKIKYHFFLANDCKN